MASETSRKIKAIIAASSGNLVEWFDFYIYAFCAIYFAPHFFPKGDSTAQLLNTAAIFAIGFLMRPIGGWLFGRIADKHGRKKSLVISVLMMCFGSLMIACIPGYETIGVFAPICLVFARMFQGLSVGGEYGTTATYMSEVASSSRRGFFSSFQYVTLIGGQLLAVLVLFILQQIFSETQLKEWAWRIPFVIGALSAVIALWLRGGLEETATIDSQHDKEAGSMVNLLKNNWRAFGIVVGYTAAGSLSFYTFTTYMQKFLVNTAGIDVKSASTIMTCALIVFMIAQPILGALSDKIGRRNNMLLFSSLTAAITIPAMTFLSTNSSDILAFIVISVCLICVSFYTSIAGIVKSEVFPMKVRALGVGFSYAIGNAIFGGTAEFVALLFKNIGHESLFFWYVASIVAISIYFSSKVPKKPTYLSD